MAFLEVIEKIGILIIKNLCPNVLTIIACGEGGGSPSPFFRGGGLFTPPPAGCEAVSALQFCKSSL